MRQLRMFSRNGFEVTRGSTEITVGKYVVTLNASILCASVSVFRQNEKLAIRTWAGATPDTIRDALSYAERLNGQGHGGPHRAQPKHAYYSPECVEDASGRCTHPLHSHKDRTP